MIKYLYFKIKKLKSWLFKNRKTKYFYFKIYEQNCGLNKIKKNKNYI